MLWVITYTVIIQQVFLKLNPLQQSHLPTAMQAEAVLILLQSHISAASEIQLSPTA